MNRRTFFAMSAGIATLNSQAQIPRRTSRPNILMLIADQFRKDCIGLYGNPVIRTPNLDRIGCEGVRFSSAYSSTPTCTPARSALLTGLSPWHHGMLGMTNMADRYPLETPRALAEAGYFTITIGKNHFFPIRNSHGYHQMVTDEHCSYWFHNTEAHPAIPAPAEERCDYEAWFWSQEPNLDPHATGLSWNDYRGRAFALPERLHATTWTGDTAVHFLNTYQRPEPFFLKVSFIRPHSPYDPPQRILDLYKDAEIPEPRTGKWASRYTVRSGPDHEIWHGALDPPEVRQSRQAYYASVTHVDEQIGRILEALEQRHLLDETVIVFLSDHGDMLGDHNLWRKSYGYEQSAHIPMLMRLPKGFPSASPGQVIAEPVELRDILPAFLEISGIPLTRDIDGRSLVALLKRHVGWREYIDLEHNICYSPVNHWNGLTDGRWKYIFHAKDGEEQLFDLQHDPDELTDLASDGAHEKELRLWRNRLVEHLSERGSAFVKSGRLMPRPEGMMLSPNFPGYGKQGLRAPGGL